MSRQEIILVNGDRPTELYSIGSLKTSCNLADQAACHWLNKNGKDRINTTLHICTNPRARRPDKDEDVKYRLCVARSELPESTA
jgi:hypothetical protein